MSVYKGFFELKQSCGDFFIACLFHLNSDIFTFKYTLLITLKHIFLIRYNYISFNKICHLKKPNLFL